MLTSIANSISPMIKMESDVCSKYPDGKLPIVDLKVWINKSEGEVSIRHQFYKKPMASRLTIMAHSAYPTSPKRAALVEEAMRRMRNCSPELAWEEKCLYLSEFAHTMRKKLPQALFQWS